MHRFMRVQFPYALGVGTDIVAHSRILRAIQSSQSKAYRLVNRFLHPIEIIVLNSRFPNWQQTSSEVDQARLATYLAGRWAAKEAAKKAWGAHLLSFRDLRVEQLPEGDVAIVCQSFNGTKHQHDDADVEQVAKLSISHDGDYAVATVLATPLHSDIIAALEARKVSIDRTNDLDDQEDSTIQSK